MNKEMQIPIGTKIKFYRKRQGLSQKEVAQKLGIISTTYCKYENNVHKPKKELVQRIADILEINVRELLDDYLFSYMNGIGTEIEDQIPSTPDNSIIQLEKLLDMFNYKCYNYPSQSSQNWNIHISDNKASIDIDCNTATKLYNDIEHMVHLLFLELIHNQKN